MARGLKISHERDDGTLVDQEVSTTISSIGGTGGRPQWVTVQGVKTVKVQFRTDAGILHSNAYIVSQKGAKQFRVANAVGATESVSQSNASVTIGTLAAGADAANAAPASGASTMTVTGYNTSNTRFYVKRISNKFVWDFSDVRYRWRTSDSVATSTFANVECH
jgi:hypothetical protein